MQGAEVPLQRFSLTITLTQLFTGSKRRADHTHGDHSGIALVPIVADCHRSKIFIVNWPLSEQLCSLMIPNPA
jgi:hypothetical protein